MKLQAAAVIVIAFVTSARAAPIYIEGGTMVGWGGGPVIGPHVTGTIGGGVELAAHGLWVHARGSYGPAYDVDDGSGDLGQAIIGAEYRLCVSRAVCFVPALDLGGQRATWHPMPNEVDHRTEEIMTALVIVPRIGLDVGTATTRVRFGVELTAVVVGSEHDRQGVGMTVTGLIGADVALGIVRQW